MDNYPPRKESDTDYSLGDILRSAIAQKQRDGHAHYYETLTSQYEAAGFATAVRQVSP